MFDSSRPNMPNFTPSPYRSYDMIVYLIVLNSLVVNGCQYFDDWNNSIQFEFDNSKSTNKT